MIRQPTVAAGLTSIAWLARYPAGPLGATNSRVGELKETLVHAARLREESQRRQQHSLTLRAIVREQRLKSRALTWRARDSRATLTYTKLLDRLRDGAVVKSGPGPGLKQRIHSLEARISELIADRDAFFDAFERYLRMERSR